MLKHAAGILCLVVLAGCSSGSKQEQERAELTLVRALGSAVSGLWTPAPPPTQLSRALLDTIELTYIELSVESRGVTGFVARELEQYDDLPGSVTVWRSDDGGTVALRNGLLIATRGLGHDLLSAQVPAAEGLQGPARGGERSYTLRAGDNEAQRLVMACSLTDLGVEEVEIVEITYRTRHLQERCEGSGGEVVNDYWIGLESGLVWQSRQWAGPALGYLRLRRLTL